MRTRLARSGFAALITTVIGLDEWGRATARARTFIADHGWVRFELYWNEGFFGGDGASFSPLLNQVFLSSLSLLFVALLCMIGFIYRKDRIFGLGPGLALFGTGLATNVADRIAFGRVTDWVVVKRLGLDNYAFNLADLLIGSGILILGFLISFRSERFWRDSQIRDKILIERRFQFGLAAYLASAALVACAITTIASLVFFRWFLLAPDTTSIRTYVALFAGVAIALAAVGTLAGVLYSRTLFGPILALESLILRALGASATNRDLEFALRKDDSFQSLGALGRSIAKKSLASNVDPTAPNREHGRGE